MRGVSKLAVVALFSAIATFSSSCQKEDLLDLIDVLNISVPVPKGTTVTANGKVEVALSGDMLTKTEEGEYVYDFSIDTKETGVNFEKFADKVDVHASHFQVCGKIVNDTDYDLCGTVEVDGGDTKIEMDAILPAHASTPVAADVFCNGKLNDIRKATFHVSVIGGDDKLFDVTLPEVKVSCEEVRFLSGGSIKI